MDSATNLEAFLKRDRWFVLAGLAGATALAWATLVVMAVDMDVMAMPAPMSERRPDALERMAMRP